MASRKSSGFELDPRLEADTEHVMWLGLCELRLMNDRRFPWFVLIPQRPDMTEIFDLTPLDQAMLTFEINHVAQMLKEQTGCYKINCAALGNMVRQLHVHVIARNENDAAWPNPVWGYGPSEPYLKEELHQTISTLKSRI